VSIALLGNDPDPQVAAGHRIEVMLAGRDVNYRGGLTSTAVTVSTGSSGQALTLPVVS
jgi:hypothetical protein